MPCILCHRRMLTGGAYDGANNYVMHFPKSKPNAPLSAGDVQPLSAGCPSWRHCTIGAIISPSDANRVAGGPPRRAAPGLARNPKLSIIVCALDDTSRVFRHDGQDDDETAA